MTKLDDVTTRLEASQAATVQAVSDVMTAATTEIKQLADAISGTTDQSNIDRLNKVADNLDAANVTLGNVVGNLAGDDPPPAT